MGYKITLGSNGSPFWY